MKPAVGISVTTGATLMFTIKNISELYGRISAPEATIVRGLPWKIVACPIEDKVNRFTSFGVGLYCGWNENSLGLICTVDMETRIMAQTACCPDFTTGLVTNTFRSGERPWVQRIISWQELVAPTSGFLLDDSIILELKFKADAPIRMQHYKLYNVASLDNNLHTKFNKILQAPAPPRSLELQNVAMLDTSAMWAKAAADCGHFGENPDGGDSVGRNGGTEDSEEDSGAEDSEAENSDTEDSDTEESEVGDSDTEESEVGDSDTEESEHGDSDTEESEDGDSDTEESEDGDSDTEESEVGDSDTEDSDTKDSETGNSDLDSESEDSESDY